MKIKDIAEGEVVRLGKDPYLTALERLGPSVSGVNPGPVNYPSNHVVLKRYNADAALVVTWWPTARKYTAAIVFSEGNDSPVLDELEPTSPQDLYPWVHENLRDWLEEFNDAIAAMGSRPDPS